MLFVGDRQIGTIAKDWDEVCELARLSPEGKRFFEGRQFLNPYAFEGYSTPSPWAG